MSLFIKFKLRLLQKKIELIPYCFYNSNCLKQNWVQIMIVFDVIVKALYTYIKHEMYCLFFTSTPCKNFISYKYISTISCFEILIKRN